MNHDVFVTLVYAFVVVILATSCGSDVSPAAALGSPVQVSTPQPTEPPLSEEVVWSPDGRWVARSLASAPVTRGTGDAESTTYHVVLTVVRVDGSREWKVIDDELRYGLGWSAPRVLQWSRDGRYLYYTHFVSGDGCALFISGTDLWRVDLQDGRTLQLAPDVSISIALSPDETTLAYIDGTGAPTLVLRDLATAAERRVPVGTPGQQAGNIRWLPGDGGLEVTLAAAPCTEDTTYSIVHVAR